MNLRPYQREAIDAVWTWMRANAGNPCVVLPTGSGKTIVMAEMIREALTQWPGTRICVLAHVRELVAQNAEKLAGHWPGAPIGVYSAGLRRRDRFDPVIFASIQSVAGKALQLGRFDLVLVDEAHRIPLKAEGQYRQFIAECLRINPHLRVCGLTATPYRLGGGPVCDPEHILHEVVYDANVGDLIREGFLCRLVSKSGATKADISGVHIRQGEYIARELEAAVDTDDVVEAACDEIVSLCHDRRAWIVFCAGVQHARHVTEALARRGVACAMVDGKTPARDRDARIGEFQAGRLRALVNVNVLSEGFDAQHVDAVILMRPTKSAGLYYQQCLDSRTEILTRAGWKGIDTIGTDDEIAAADCRADVPALSWELPLEVIDRPLGGEKMFEIFGPGVDMRLTGGHAMIVSARREKGWNREYAERAAQRRSDYKIPVATVEAVASAPLSDDEIRFIGWFMTDGNLNKHNQAITISQSSAQPWFDEIERVIVACGLKYSKRLVTAATQFNESASRYNFIISKGLPRGRDKHLSGWARLEPWLSKDLAPALDALDERQFGILLEAIHLGDGSKQTGQYWTRRSYHIVTVNPVFADRLQSLCLRRGWRCNIGRTWSRETELLTLHVKKQAFRCVGGIGQFDRASLRESASTPDERVWCVRVPSGAFIARRNGKAFVTGNCGRGLRLHPSKETCLILDFAGNVLEHGPIDAIRPPKRPGEKASRGAPVRECPECQTLSPIQAIECPECGYQWPEPERAPAHFGTAFDAPILSEQAPDTWCDVSHIHYARHDGKSGVPTLRVTYQCGLRTFREWVCFEHSGYAREKAVLWWIKRTDLPIPRTIDEARANSHALATPKRIQVRERGKYPEILRHEFDPDTRSQGPDARHVA